MCVSCLVDAWKDAEDLQILYCEENLTSKIDYQNNSFKKRVKLWKQLHFISSLFTYSQEKLSLS